MDPKNDDAIPVCPVCGSRLGVRTAVGIICSSAYRGPGEMCHECQVDCCLQTNCLGCTIGTYPDCRHLPLKLNYMED